METSAESSPTGHSSTANRILDAAQDLMQRRGYNAVSYGDLAKRLDLTTAAIHYHFPSKADLGEAVVARYRQENAKQRTAISKQKNGLRARLEAYIAGYVSLLESGGLCLCAVLSTDDETLPRPVRREVRRFFSEQEDWLTVVISEDDSHSHKDSPGLPGYESPRQVAELLLATIEGAMLTTEDRTSDTYRAILHRLVRAIAS